MTWSAAQIGDQSGKRVVITGANGGLGSVTAKVLADCGATVVLACRNVGKAQAVADSIGGAVEVVGLDLADLASVRAFAEQQGELDVLINNAGLMNIPNRRTADGFEMQFGVNHLGHFALTAQLIDRITDRVVTLSSIAHAHTPMLWINDLNYEYRFYQRNLAYAQSKLANLMFARELERRLFAAGSPVRSYAVHPGVSGTELFARTESIFDRIGQLGASVIGHAPERAAESTLYAATQRVDPSKFWGPTGGITQSRGPVRQARSTRLSKNLRLAERLWEESERLTGVTFDVAASVATTPVPPARRTSRSARKAKAVGRGAKPASPGLTGIATGSMEGKS